MRTSPDDSLLITGARVYTSNPDQPWAEAMVTRGNRIQFVGPLPEARTYVDSHTEQIHLPGGLAIPGLNDSHVHMTMGAYDLNALNLEGVFGTDELQDRLRLYAGANPDKEWIEAYGLPYEPLTGLSRPERDVLDDAVSDRPVFVKAFDSHSTWVNSAALKRAGIERGVPLSPPNEVVIDPESGRATGMLKERHAQALVTRLIAEPTPRQRDDFLCAAARHMNCLGITSVQNMDGDLDRLQQYRRLQQDDHLSIRAHHYMSFWEATPLDYLEECADYTRVYADAWSRTSGIKLFIDGVVESKTALLLEPYADGSGDRGVPDIDLDIYRRVVAAADRLDLDIATHAIGDRGVRLTLDAYEAAQHDNGGRHSRRHRVEHIEVIHASDIVRFGRLGVTASMQPLHAAPTTDPSHTPWTRLVGPAREPYAFVWRRLADSGARLTFGSDWPIVAADARAGMHTAITRTTVTGEPEGGWQPQQTVTLSQALDAYTRGASYIERQDHHKGLLSPGMLADIAVFAHDPFRVAAHDILRVPIALTVLDGRIVHRME